MKCPNCGEEVKSGAKFCNKCGTRITDNFNSPKIKPINKKMKWWLPLIFLLIFLFFSLFGSFVGNSLNNEFLGDIFSKISAVSLFLIIPSYIFVIVEYNIKTKEQKTIEKENFDNYINSNESLDNKLLYAYIGKNYQTIMNKTFSCSAFFLNEYYMFYRKMYIPALILSVLLSIIARFSSKYAGIVLIIIYFILGFVFNKLYVKYAKYQVNKIKVENPDLSENELINLCLDKGGTNLIYVLIPIFLNVILSVIYYNVIKH